MELSSKTWTATRILLAGTFLAFAALTVRALQAYGYLGFFEVTRANTAINLLFNHLVVGLVLISVWMVRDARQANRLPRIYLLVTGAFGVAGPLVYLALRPERPVASGRSSTGGTLLVGALLFVGLTAWTVWTVRRHGVLAIFLYAASNEATQLIIVDLAITSGFIAGWTAGWTANASR